MIRLQRVGRKNDPSFRVVVTDSRRGPKSGNNIEIVGSHNKSQGAPVIDADRVKYWISKGAKVSDTMHNLLIKKGIIQGKTIDLLPTKKANPVVEEAPASVENSGEAQSAPTEVSTEEASASVENSGETQPAPEAPAETPVEAPVEAPAEETKSE